MNFAENRWVGIFVVLILTASLLSVSMRPNLPKRILFVCYGNTCRSPMAKTLAKQMLSASDYQIYSAGIGAVPGLPASVLAQKVMQNTYNANMEGHAATPVQSLNLNDFDHIIALDAMIYDYLANTYPQTLPRLIGWQIADPYGTALTDYQTCAEKIYDTLQIWILQINK
ncbi:MAG TPA: hypothetical protein PK239_16190 [Chitinophagales bacterium]|nr:hypothetical protein [Chitinophagales bacterium]HRK28815.1 hypothetical protein [Chitinophagales bacterium]